MLKFNEFLNEAKGKKTSDIFKKTIKYLTNKPFIYFDEKTKTLKKQKQILLSLGNIMKKVMENLLLKKKFKQIKTI